MSVIQFRGNEIKLLQVGQLDDAARLLHSSWHNFYPRHLPAEVTSEKNLDEFERYLDQHSAHTWMALRNQKPVGILCVTSNCIDELWVKPRFRRKGIGSSLVAQALEYMRNRGFTTAQVGLESFNVDGEAFFEGTGWRMIGAESMRLQPGYEFEARVYSTAL